MKLYILRSRPVSTGGKNSVGSAFDLGDYIEIDY